MTTAYDVIAYPTRAFDQTHPERLATHARLFGIDAPPVETSRVLDIAGGDGFNAISMAVALPRARIVSFDLAAEAVARGQGVIADLGLKNIQLKVADILAPDLGDEPFDYICAHGIYSWIPEHVRGALMALIGTRLSPNGVAFVSYNALPGCRIRQVLRDMLRFRLRHIEGTLERAQAIGPALARIVEETTMNDPFHAAIRMAAESMAERHLRVVAHDEMGDVYHPVHLFEFCQDAQDHGLQFLTEAEVGRSGEGFNPPDAADDPNYDVLEHAQEMDFEIARSFRQSLLVQGHHRLDRRPNGDHLSGLLVASPALSVGGGHFQVRDTDFEIIDAELATMFERLGPMWPLGLPIGQVLKDEPRRRVLLRLYWSNLLELRTTQGAYNTVVGDRPMASPLARWQAARGETILSTLRHDTLDVTDPVGLAFVASLDGTRTRQALLAEALALRGGDEATVALALDASLAGLARAGLMFG